MSTWREAERARFRANISPQRSPRRVPNFSDHGVYCRIPRSNTRASIDTTVTADSVLTEADRAPFVLESRYINILRPTPPTHPHSPLPYQPSQVETTKALQVVRRVSWSTRIEQEEALAATLEDPSEFAPFDSNLGGLLPWQGLAGDNLEFPRSKKTLQVLDDKPREEPGSEYLNPCLLPYEGPCSGSVFGINRQGISSASAAAERSCKSNLMGNPVVVNPYAELHSKNLLGWQGNLSGERLEEQLVFEGNLDPYGGKKLTRVRDSDPKWQMFRMLVQMGESREWLEKGMELLFPSHPNQNHPSQENSNQDVHRSAIDKTKNTSLKGEYECGNHYDVVKDAFPEASAMAQLDALNDIETFDDGIKTVIEIVEHKPQNCPETIEDEFRKSPSIAEGETQSQPKRNFQLAAGLELIPGDCSKRLEEDSEGVKLLSEITDKAKFVGSQALAFKYKLETKLFSIARKHPDFVVSLKEFICMMRLFMTKLTTGTLGGWRLFKGVDGKRVRELYDRYCLALTIMVRPMQSMAQYYLEKTKVQVLRDEMVVLLTSMMEIVERIDAGIEHHMYANAPYRQGSEALDTVKGAGRDIKLGNQFYGVSKIEKCVSQWKKVDNRRTVVETLTFWGVGPRF